MRPGRTVCVTRLNISSVRIRIEQIQLAAAVSPNVVGLEVAVVLAEPKPLAFEEWNGFVQHREVAARLNIVCGGAGEPYPIV